MFRKVNKLLEIFQVKDFSLTLVVSQGAVQITSALAATNNQVFAFLDLEFALTTNNDFTTCGNLAGSLDFNTSLGLSLALNEELALALNLAITLLQNFDKDKFDEVNINKMVNSEHGQSHNLSRQAGKQQTQAPNTYPIKFSRALDMEFGLSLEVNHSTSLDSCGISSRLAVDSRGDCVEI